MKKKEITQEELDKVASEALEWKNKCLRALADYQNLEKRIIQDQIEQVKFTSMKVLREFLDVFDTLQKAEQHVKDEGLTLGMKNMWSVFEKNGVTKIEVKGKKFDPMVMECIEVTASLVDNEVVNELQAGYQLHGKVLRVAKVTVGKKTDLTARLDSEKGAGEAGNKEEVKN